MITSEINSKEEFEEAVSGDRVIVDYFASWCGPCRQIAPLLEELSAPVVKVDVDANPGLAQEYGVMGLPTVAVFEGGQELQRRTGAMSKSELQNLYEA